MIDPILRTKYALKVKELLHKNGKLPGLLFEAKLNDKHSPLGGSKKEYLTYFTPHFDLHTMESPNKSIQN